MTPQEFKDRVAGMEIKEEWKDAIVTVGIPTSYFQEEKEPSNKLLCGYYQEFVFEDGDTRKFLILSTREFEEVECDVEWKKKRISLK